MNGEVLNELALFAGAGGGILGGKLLGWRTVCAVECDKYAASVLVRRQNDGYLPPFPVWDDVRTFDGSPWRGIAQIVSGGFPCQDISAAGKGAGIDGERSGLWKEFARIIGEVRPRFVYVENSPILTSRGLGRVLGDLAALGFDAEWGVVSAADAIFLAGDPCLYHERERIWIVATSTNSDNDLRRTERRSGGGCEGKSGLQEESRGVREGMQFTDDDGPSEVCEAPDSSRERRGEGRPESVGKQGRLDADECGGEVSDAVRVGWQPRRSDYRCDDGGESPAESQVTGYGSSERLEEREGERGNRREKQPPAFGASWWATEPSVGRVANGVAYRVDRLRAIGNGQVPSVASLAWRILSERLYRRLTEKEQP